MRILKRTGSVVVLLMLAVVPLCAFAASTTCPAVFFGPTDSSSMIGSNYPTPYNSHTGSIGYHPEPGVARTLITWDFSNVPSGMKVVSATLALGADQWRSGANVTVEIYRILVSFNPMHCTWTNRDTTTAWNVAGVVGGTGIAATPFATFQWTYGAGYQYIDVSDAVKNWVDGTWQNHGALIRFIDESTNQSGPYYTFATNGSLSGQSGTIDVTYDGSDITINNIETHLGIQFESFPGYEYTVHWSSNTDNWSLADIVLAEDYTTSWIDIGGVGRDASGLSSVSQRFYRIDIDQN